MRYVELDIFGVFVSPVSAMMLAAFVVFSVLRKIARWCGLWRYLWHPALASMALYVIVLSVIVIGVGR
jgi:hypothetical protein